MRMRLLLVLALGAVVPMVMAQNPTLWPASQVSVQHSPTNYSVTGNTSEENFVGIDTRLGQTQTPDMDQNEIRMRVSPGTGQPEDTQIINLQSGATPAPTDAILGQKAGGDLVQFAAGDLGGGGGAGIPWNQAVDSNGDTLTDTAYIADWDTSGQMDDQDIVAAQAVLTASCTTLFLAPGAWVLDENANGTGDTYASGGLNSHIRLKSCTNLIGYGIHQTVMTMNPSTTDNFGYGSSPFIGGNGDGVASIAATVRQEKVHISDLTVRGHNTTQVSTTGDGANIGIALYDMDNSSAERVSSENTGHAAYHITRADDVWVKNSKCSGNGNYDWDGAGPQTPSGQQPATYLYSGGGIINQDSGYINVDCMKTGGIGLRTRANSHATRPGPFGNDSLVFTTGLDYMRQVFTASISTAPAVAIVIEPHAIAGATPSGSVEVAIYNATDGNSTPELTPVTGHDFGDWQQLDVADLGIQTTAQVFLRTSDLYAETVDALVVGSKYTLVARATGTPDSVALLWDDSATADTYSGGNVWIGSAADVGTQQTSRDLNFSVYDGWILRPRAHLMSFNGITGSNLEGGSCVSMSGTSEASLSNITCSDSLGFVIGDGNYVLDTNLVDSSASATHISITGVSPSTVIGQLSYGTTFDNVSVEHWLGDCISLKPWAHRFMMLGGSLKRCGGKGLQLLGGNRDIVLDGINYLNPDSDSIYFSLSSDSDGISGGIERVDILNSRFIGGLSGIRGVTTAKVRSLNITNNTFQGQSGDGLRLWSNAAGDWAGVNISNNRFLNWAQNPNGCPTAHDSFGIYSRGLNNLGIWNNLFQHDGVSCVTRAIAVRFGVGGDGIRVGGNGCWGPYQNADCIQFLSYGATDARIFDTNFGNTSVTQ